MTQFTHDTFISPFTWRYGSKEMREIFSERHKRILMRTVWIALAKAEAGCGLVTPEQIAELEAHKYDIDIERAGEIEAEIKHDVMAEIRTYAEQCPKAGAIIHLGATSMDVLDNMDAMRLKEALDIIISRSRDLLSAFTEKAEEYKGLACMAFTHLQPAEITTAGYRISQSIQDLCDDITRLDALPCRETDLVDVAGQRCGHGVCAHRRGCGSRGSRGCRRRCGSGSCGSGCGSRLRESRLVFRLDDGFALFHFHFVNLSVESHFVNHNSTSNRPPFLCA